jgi:hypothetical protein
MPNPANPCAIERKPMPSAATLSWPSTSAARTISASLCNLGFGEIEIFENRIKTALRAAMVQFYGCNLWSVEGSCILYSRSLKQIFLFDKSEFGLRIDETFD